MTTFFSILGGIIHVVFIAIMAMGIFNTLHEMEEKNK